MRNVIVTEDFSTHFQIDPNDAIVAIQNISVISKVAILVASGKLFLMNQDDTILTCMSSQYKFIDLNVEDITSDEWFDLSLIIESNSIIAISHQGYIVRISLDNCTQYPHDDNDFSPEIELEGQVDDGITCAQWNSDKSILVILSKNDTLLFMTVYMELVKEISIEPRVVSSPASISWSSDGTRFALSTVDKSDNITKIRFYSKDGEMMNMGRNVADGLAAIVRGLNSASIAYAPNNTLIASSMMKSSTRYQIAFFEPNGLRHGEFDLQVFKRMRQHILVCYLQLSCAAFDTWST